MLAFESYTKQVSSVWMSEDGRLGLSGGEDHALRTWEVTTGKSVQTFEGHTDDVLCVCLSPDGRYALTGSEDRTLRLWDLAAGQCAQTFRGHGAIGCLPRASAGTDDGFSRGAATRPFAVGTSTAADAWLRSKGTTAP